MELKAPDDSTLRSGILPQLVPDKSVLLMVRNSCGLLIAGKQGFVPRTRDVLVLSESKHKLTGKKRGLCAKGCDATQMSFR